MASTYIPLETTSEGIAEEEELIEAVEAFVETVSKSIFYQILDEITDFLMQCTEILFYYIPILVDYSDGTRSIISDVQSCFLILALLCVSTIVLSPEISVIFWNTTSLGRDGNGSWVEWLSRLRHGWTKKRNPQQQHQLYDPVLNTTRQRQHRPKRRRIFSNNTFDPSGQASLHGLTNASAMKFYRNTNIQHPFKVCNSTQSSHLLNDQYSESSTSSPYHTWHSSPASVTYNPILAPSDFFRIGNSSTSQITGSPDDCKAKTSTRPNMDAILVKSPVKSNSPSASFDWDAAEPDDERFQRMWPMYSASTSKYSKLVLPPTCRRVFQYQTTLKSNFVSSKTNLKKSSTKRTETVPTNEEDNPAMRLQNYVRQVWIFIRSIISYDYTRAGWTLITWLQGFQRIQEYRRRAKSRSAAGPPILESNEEEEADEELQTDNKGSISSKNDNEADSRKLINVYTHELQESFAEPSPIAAIYTISNCKTIRESDRHGISDFNATTAVSVLGDNDNRLELIGHIATSSIHSTLLPDVIGSNRIEEDETAENDCTYDNIQNVPLHTTKQLTNRSNTQQKSFEKNQFVSVPEQDVPSSDETANNAFTPNCMRNLKQQHREVDENDTLGRNIDRCMGCSSTYSLSRDISGVWEDLDQTEELPDTVIDKSIEPDALLTELSLKLSQLSNEDEEENSARSSTSTVIPKNLKQDSSTGSRLEQPDEKAALIRSPIGSLQRNDPTQHSLAHFFDTAESPEGLQQLALDVLVPDKNGYILSESLLPDPKNSTPLLVFVNSRSGPQQGHILITQFRRLLNPIQVWDLADGGPEAILESFAVFSRLRILVCGGDGTVAWIISALERLDVYKQHAINNQNSKSQIDPNSTTSGRNRSPDVLWYTDSAHKSRRQWPPIAILPLGTGNDLARIHGWGGGYNNESLITILEQISESYISLLDRWEVTITGRRSKKKEVKSFFNYLGVGADAQAALQVHYLRESRPEWFFSRLVNKAMYGLFGAEDIIKASSVCTREYIKLIADGVEIPLPADSQGIIILNIDSYAGGVPLWSHGTKINAQNANSSELNKEVASFRNGLRRSRSASSLYMSNSTNFPSIPKSSKTRSRDRFDSRDDSAAILSMEARYASVTACNFPSSCQDGILDIVSIRGAFHLGQIKVGLSNAQRLCQCREVTIVISNKVAVQVDGEPWRQNSSTLTIKRKKEHATMLHRSSDDGGVEMEMSKLLDWAEERKMIDSQVHSILMKEFSRRIESKKRQHRARDQDKNIMSTLKKAISSTAMATNNYSNPSASLHQWQGGVF